MAEDTYWKSLTLHGSDGTTYNVTVDSPTADRLLNGDADLIRRIISNCKDSAKGPDKPCEAEVPKEGAQELRTSATNDDAPLESGAWTSHATRELIRLREVHAEDFKSPKTVNKRLWERVAQELGEVIQVTGLKAETKWKNLLRRYKLVRDHNNKSGNSRKDWEFFEDMHNVLKDSPNIQPKYTVSAAPSSSSNPPSTSVSGHSQDSPEATECSSSGKRGQKRKYQSKNNIVLDLFKQIKEKNETAEEKRLNMLKQMHDEKMTLMSSLVDVLKKE